MRSVSPTVSDSSLASTSEDITYFVTYIQITGRQCGDAIRSETKKKKKKTRCNFQVNTDFQLFNSKSVAVLSRKLIGFDLLRVSTTCQQARPVDSFPPSG